MSTTATAPKNQLTAAAVLEYVLNIGQIDLVHESLEGQPPEIAAELDRRIRLAGERGYLTFTPDGLYAPTAAGAALIGRS